MLSHTGTSSCQSSLGSAAPAHCALPYEEVGVLHLTGLLRLGSQVLPRKGGCAFEVLAEKGQDSLWPEPTPMGVVQAARTSRFCSAWHDSACTE